MENKKKKIVIIAILIFIIITFIIPVRIETEIKNGNKSEINNIIEVTDFDRTIYNYKNIYGITIKTETRIGVKEYWKNKWKTNQRL